MNFESYYKSLPRSGKSGLAKRCRVSASYLSQIAAGIRKPNGALAIEIEKATGGRVKCETTYPDADWAYVRETSFGVDSDDSMPSDELVS